MVFSMTFKKLRRNSSQLEILGDGTQTKSYLFVKDCVGAILMAYETAQAK